ncbi:hypothetical protein EJMOOK_13155 [Rhodanobacter sp. Root179]
MQGIGNLEPGIGKAGCTRLTVHRRPSRALLLTILHSPLPIPDSARSQA